MDNCFQPVQTAAQQIPDFSHETAAKIFYSYFLLINSCVIHNQPMRSCSHFHHFNPAPQLITSGTADVQRGQSHTAYPGQIPKKASFLINLGFLAGVLHIPQ
ncbi:TPA: hypothetical protein QCH54_001808 [Enterobacter ludwigii]|uniref:hypothetical protein n=1 Tax=Enterobacter ludwigii TaxID=299767 RepID=UPI00163956EE|nr:hypothetical protein [Enterobacter ludwigii]MBK1521231.1 hypothetical protein [Enterobacter ludwigii]HDR2277788.1 hypothetical protein [Enterobacter ludwigii]